MFSNYCSFLQYQATEDDKQREKQVVGEMLMAGGKKPDAIAKSTGKVIAKFNDEWETFCDLNPKWCKPKEWPPILTIVENKTRKIWWCKILHFIQFCNENPKITPTRFKDAILFCQTYCKRECQINGVYDLCPDGTIGKQPGIAALKDSHYRTKATRDLIEGNDVQALIDPEITTKQMIMMAHAVFKPPDPNMANMCLLARLQTYVQMRDTHMTAVRGINCREATLGMQFVRNLRQTGEVDDLYVYAAGKTNQYGHREYNGIAPHVNPLLDFSANLGLCFLIRFGVMMEPFPCHVNGVDILNRPVYRSSHSPFQFVGGSTQSDQFVTLYRCCGIFVHKITHMVSDLCIQQKPPVFHKAYQNFSFLSTGPFFMHE